ncbi:MAG: ClpXP protease specificity-enhancing factor [Burkholderiales bacterium PBB3]|nr:MAG: ClpXP protease specificity-enhancing factor [Burkholderiales bacterium PBB3]
MIEAKDSSSTRPYLIRALYEWCTDNGYTPFLAVLVNESVRVPMEFVKDGEIVLNISFDATSALSLGNEFIEFKGRFGGVARDIVVPVERVLAIYARENGQGMAFPMLAASSAAQESPVITPVKSVTPIAPVVAVAAPTDDGGAPSPKPSGGARPALTRIK